MRYLMLVASIVALATAPLAAQELGTSQGEVRKVDKDASKVTLRHGPITELKMPAMSMVFQVKDPKMLDQLKEGDKIRFVTSRQGGAFTLESFEPER
jgi:Cu(I)/Ag(I) efflux system periplasmic protein CusF